MLDDLSHLQDDASVIPSTTRIDRLYTLCTQGVPRCLALVSTVCEEGIRIAAWPDSLSLDSGVIGEDVECLRMANGIRWRSVDNERYSAPTHDESVIRAKLPLANWPWTRGVSAAKGSEHDAVDDRQFGREDASLRKHLEKVHLEIDPRTNPIPPSKSSASSASRSFDVGNHFSPTATGQQNVPVHPATAWLRNTWATVLTAHRPLSSTNGLQSDKERLRQLSTCRPGLLHRSRDHDGGVQNYSLKRD